jgi:hypothetical protein
MQYAELLSDIVSENVGDGAVIGWEMSVVVEQGE